MKNFNKSVSGIIFLDKIDEVLKEHNKTRKSLCEALGILQGTMATWKTKNLMPPIDTINKIAKELNVTVDWLISDSKTFDEKEHLLGEYSRKSIRLRVYEALNNKYKKEDNRFTDSFLSDEPLIKELHHYYFNGGYVSYEALLNWSKGRCEIPLYVFNQWALSLNSTLQFILTGSEVLIPSKRKGYSDPVEIELYDMAKEYQNELHILENLTDERKESAKKILNLLMRLEHLEYVEKTRKKKEQKNK
jgi:transcriptional regulator with XRE-family HTH domain